MSENKWTPTDLPSFDGRTVIVTGANSGIGLNAARELAAHGARVVLAVRTPEKGEAAAATMSGTTEVRRLDLADLASVREFASQWGDGDIDVLINNAGVMALPETRTADGFEMQFGTNHLGHFALTNLLLPQVKERVVTVASGAHHFGKINFDDLNWENGYSRWRAYGQSKLANLLFTSELQRRLAAAGSAVRATAAHPGYASTHLQERTGSGLQNRLMALSNKLVAQSEEQGSWPTLFAASEDIAGDSYVGPDGFLEQRGNPKLAGRSKSARDTDVAQRLWEVSEELTGVKFPLGVPASVG